jgi:hypothetical protein
MARTQGAWNSSSLNATPTANGTVSQITAVWRKALTSR